MVQRLVDTVMSAPAIVAPPDETLGAAAARMHRSHVGSVIVTDGGRPLGIVTERDLLAVTAGGTDPATVKLSEVMSSPLDTVRSGLSAREALRHLRERGFRHVPVVDHDGTAIGVVSLRDLMRIAEISLDTDTVDVPRGLKGVVVTETSVGDVRGREGFFHYRQHDATELARTRSFEDVWALMFDGQLPSPDERTAFLAEAAELRALPAALTAVLPGLAAAVDPDAPLAALAGVLALVGAIDGARPVLDLDQAARRRDALRLCALTPSVLCALYRLRHGLQPLEPRPELGHAANYLWMLSGEIPDPEIARAIETYLILTVDHGFNASTFTGRVIASTGASVPAAIAGAIGALSGPLHGGAPSRALDALDEIGAPERAEAWAQLATMREIQECDADFHFADLETNVGENWALLAGISKAQGEVIVTIDGDYQNDPAYIPDLLQAAVQRLSSCIRTARTASRLFLDQTSPFTSRQHDDPIRLRRPGA